MNSKRFSIILTIIGAIGIAFGFYNAPSNVEESKEIVAKMSHDGYGGDHSEGHGGGYGEEEELNVEDLNNMKDQTWPAEAQKHINTE